jgi:glycosyltransferase involved in cell wall biosynthesis
MSGITGLIVAAAAYNLSGYSVVIRNLLFGLSKIGYPTRLVEIGKHERVLDQATLSFLDSHKRVDVGKRPALVVHSVPDFYDSVIYEHVPYTIASTIFETHRIPSHWVSVLNRFDEVWVPSEFNVRTFSDSGVESSKLHKIPYSFDQDDLSRTADTGLALSNDRFYFLYVYEATYRKGIDLLLDAYTSEFTADDKVTLILKLSFPGRKWLREKEGVAKLCEMFPGKNWLTKENGPNILLVTDRYSKEQMDALYRRANLYISTDRANGWGMPCMEAMALGTPAATINWSGSTEFMDSTNSLLIAPEEELEPVDPRLVEPPLYLYQNQMWPRVRISSVQHVLRSAVDDRARLISLGRSAARHVADNFSQEKIARLVSSHLRSVEVPASRSVNMPEPVIRKRVTIAGRLRERFGLFHR